MDYTIKKIQLDDTHTLEVWQDSDSEDPKDWTETEFICWHRRYNVGTEHSFSDPDDLKNSLSEGDLILPIWGYDHSGFYVSLGDREYPFDCPWDSGLLGYAVLRVGEKGTKLTREELLSQMRSEFDSWRAYLQGEVYGFTLYEHKICEHCGVTETEPVDSCGGFYNLHDMEVYVPENYRGVFIESLS